MARDLREGTLQGFADLLAVAPQWRLDDTDLGGPRLEQLGATAIPQVNCFELLQSGVLIAADCCSFSAICPSPSHDKYKSRQVSLQKGSA